MAPPWWALLLAGAAAAGTAAAADAGAGTGAEEAQWFSQYGQDRYIYERFFATSRADKEALLESGASARGRQGVFVELGAADGLDKSNTLAFEKLLGWKGLLIEPSRPLFERLRENRPGCACVNECVAHVSGRYAFSEDGLNSGFVAYQAGGVTLDDLAAKDESGFRHCRTLPELIDEHLGRNAHIDYLSLDTEGSELDILRSFDFGRHTVDVITVEVHTWRERLRAERLAALLEARGFRFVERLVDDEIWVRRRGAYPDPGCLLPILGLTERSLQSRGGAGGGRAGAPGDVALPRGGWARTRAVLSAASETMAALVDKGRTPSLFLNGAPAALRQSLWKALKTFDQETDTALMEAQCPVGLLALALAALLLRSRKHFEPATVQSATQELRTDLVFHPMARLAHLMSRQQFRRQQMVEQAEKAGENFEVKFSLGRAWHETRFVDALESGWPLFGLLDTTARFLAMGGHLYETVGFGGMEYNIPLKVPRVPCSLELPSAGEKFDVRLLMLGGRRGARPSMQDLALDQDSCGLLAVAAARFHAARAAFGRRQRARYIGVANWTAAGCRQPRGNESELMLGAAAKRLCTGAGSEVCAAIADGARALPRRCLRLRRAPGASLQVRLPLNLAGTRTAMLVEEGERLLRAFVDRHGLYTALWASASPRLAGRPRTRPRGVQVEVASSSAAGAAGAGGAGGAGPGGGGAEARAPEAGERRAGREGAEAELGADAEEPGDVPLLGDGGGETLFGVLHSIQEIGWAGKQ